MRAATILLLVTMAPAHATSYPQPKRHDVFSPNRHFVLDVNPETKTHTVYSASDRTKPLWSFSRPVWQAPFLLSNDGTVVVTVAWQHVQVDGLDEAECVQFWNSAGIFKAYTFEEFCAYPARTWMVGIGPIGNFWRTWYTELQQDDDTFRVRTTGLFEYTFSLTDGSIVTRRLLPANLFYKPLFDVTLLVAVVAASAFGWRRFRKRRGPIRAAEGSPEK